MVGMLFHVQSEHGDYTPAPMDSLLKSVQIISAVVAVYMFVRQVTLDQTKPIVALETDPASYRSMAAAERGPASVAHAACPFGLRSRL
jgi:hypothetical protein